MTAEPGLLPGLAGKRVRHLQHQRHSHRPTQQHWAHEVTPSDVAVSARQRPSGGGFWSTLGTLFLAWELSDRRFGRKGE